MTDRLFWHSNMLSGLLVQFWILNQVRSRYVKDPGCSGSFQCRTVGDFMGLAAWRQAGITAPLFLPCPRFEVSGCEWPESGLQWKHPLMKPKLALKLVPISGLAFDLHTAHYTHFGLAKLHTLNNTNQSGGEKNILKMRKNKRKTKSNTRHKGKRQPAQFAPTWSDENGANKKREGRNCRHTTKN